MFLTELTQQLEIKSSKMVNPECTLPSTALQNSIFFIKNESEISDVKWYEISEFNSPKSLYFREILDSEISEITRKTRFSRNVRVPLTICRGLLPSTNTTAENND